MFIGRKGMGRWFTGLAASAVLGVASGCTQPPDQSCAEEVTKLRAALLQSEAFMQDMKNQVMMSERRVRDAEIERDAAMQKFAASRERLQQASQMQQPPAFATSRLPSKVQAQLEDLARRFNAKFVNNRLQLQSDLFFGSGQYLPNAKAREVLAQLAAILRSENLVLLIVGHTDSDPIKNPALINRGIRDNRMLSMVRAKSVMDELAKAGYPAQMMYATGWGDLLPLPGATGKSREDKALNRRVEILIDTAASSIFGLAEIQGITPGMAEVARGY